MEASALTHASQRGLLARRSPLLKLQGDERLIAMARNGNPGAFETIVDRYQGRLLGFCRQMLGSTEDAEDVLQEVFVNAYRAMLADEREINLRPWLYRIARNRCLNHLRKPTADAQESMDMVPMVEAASTAEKVHNREEFRQLLTDVSKLPETQRSALLLREMDAMSYEEIAQAMETSVPSVKSLLVRARISLAEASQARQLTCGEVRLELAEAAEGLRKVSGPVRRHVRDCDECADFRTQVRSNDKVLAALFPVGPLLALKGFIASKLGFGGAAGGAGAASRGRRSGGAGARARRSRRRRRRRRGQQRRRRAARRGRRSDRDEGRRRRRHRRGPHRRRGRGQAAGRPEPGRARRHRLAAPSIRLPAVAHGRTSSDPARDPDRSDRRAGARARAGAGRGSRSTAPAGRRRADGSTTADGDSDAVEALPDGDEPSAPALTAGRRAPGERAAAAPSSSPSAGRPPPPRRRASSAPPPSASTPPPSDPPPAEPPRRAAKPAAEAPPPAEAEPAASRRRARRQRPVGLGYCRPITLRRRIRQVPANSRVSASE